MVDRARYLIEHYGFEAAEAHCALEARPPVEWNKGRASIYILRTAFGVDWGERIKIIYAGDDTTDEDAMLVSFKKFTKLYGIYLIANVFNRPLKELRQHSELPLLRLLKHRQNEDFHQQIQF